MRSHFALLTLLLVCMAFTVVIVLTFRLPVNSFAFDRETGDHFRSLTPQELVVRLLTLSVLTAIMFAGIMLAMREFSRLNRR
jgi:ABC-type spermidine/putrescine transport system permease subunit I